MEVHPVLTDGPSIWQAGMLSRQLTFILFTMLI